MRIAPRSRFRPAAFHASLAPLALALALATGPCAGGSGTAEPAPGAPATTEEAAPVNASAEATMTPPQQPARKARPVSEPPPPHEIVFEPRSEWTIDDSLTTPADVAHLEILAKFPRDEQRMVIIYRRRDGRVIQRVQGRLGNYALVEEADVPPEVLHPEAAGGESERTGDENR